MFDAIQWVQSHKAAIAVVIVGFLFVVAFLAAFLADLLAKAI